MFRSGRVLLISYEVILSYFYLQIRDIQGDGGKYICQIKSHQIQNGYLIVLGA